MDLRGVDVWKFTGAKATYGTFNNAAAADVGMTDPPFQTDLTDTAHGLIAPSLLYIQGTTNYNGIRKIASVPDANSMYIYAPYVAETLAGTETWKTMISYNCPFELIGYDIYLTVACANAENLTINIDANAGSAFDRNVYTKAMNTVQSDENMFDPRLRLEAGDRVDVVWANAGSKTWGLKLYTRRLV